MAKPKMTEALARAVGADEANRLMRAAGRTSWSEEDYNAAVAEFNRLWPDPFAGERFRLVNRESGAGDQTPPTFIPGKMAYVVQCRDNASGKVGDFGYDRAKADADKCFIAITPIFDSLADFFLWTKKHNIVPDHSTYNFPSEGPKLTPEQMEEAKKEMVPTGVPVRFQVGGRTLGIQDGHLQKKGINVIHQIVYWYFTRETSLKIAKWLGATPIFSK